MVAAPIIYSSLVIVAMYLCCFIVNSEGEAFSVSLIHPDSPISPFYNPHETSFRRLEKALTQSINRINYLSSSNNIHLTAYSELMGDLGGGFLMNISIGTPPFQLLASVDTGSNVIWTTCSAYPNKGFLFTPKLSYTYKTLPCPSRACDYLGFDGGFCSPINDHVCHYKNTYVDESHTLGDFAFETLTLEPMSTPGRTISLQNTLIGCSYDTQLSFVSKGSGIIGLGRGPASLINQLGPSIDWRFSYCLPFLHGPPGTIDFGKNVIGNGVVSTPLIYDPLRPSYFFLRLEAMSVGNVRIPFGGSPSEDQNIIIDSGAVYTVLPTGFFSQLLLEVGGQIVSKKRVVDPSGASFPMCYELGPADTINAPPVTMNFLGADVELPLSNIFLRVSDTVLCFAFKPRDDITVYGNLAQRNFLIGYDLQNMVVSFKPADCGHI
ncbi:Aspartic proteinase CDR1 [Linum grandiflorum]